MFHPRANTLWRATLAVPTLRPWGTHTYTAAPRHLHGRLSYFATMTATIITHNGSFHADEALAVFLIRQLPEWRDAELVRTRNPDVIAEASTAESPRIVLDVGGKYVPDENRFDHHQREFKDTFSEKYPAVRLSSAGLVYKHFGKRIVATIALRDHKKNIGDLLPKLANDKEALEKVTVDDLVEQSGPLDVIYHRIYDSLILAFDAIDNGVNPFATDLEPIYKDSTGISSRVGRLNPLWNDERASSTEYENEQFEKASALCGEEFLSKVFGLIASWLPAKSITQRSFDARFKYDDKGRIVVLEGFCPWKDHLHDIERENNIAKENETIYCLYSDSRSGQWRIQAVATRPGSFESRKAMPEAWRGVRDEDLEKLIGIPGAVFVHATGFIGGNKTFDGALEMARAALKE